MRILFIFFFIAFAGSANAAVVMETGLGVSFEKQPDGVSNQTQMPWLMRAGWGFVPDDLMPADVMLEYQSLDRTSSDSSSSTQSTERQLSLLVRKSFFVPYLIKPYAGVSMGARQESLKSTFLNQTEEVDGEAQWLASAFFGGIARISNGFSSHADGFFVEFEGRAATSPGYQPDPQLSLAGLLSYRF